MIQTSKIAGLIHTPLTPFTADDKLDIAALERVVDFHVANGADAICAPTHVGESPSLREEERRELIRRVTDTVNRRVPVIAHISNSGTMLAAQAAADAEKAGADAVLTTAPYYWKPPETMLLHHFIEIGKAASIPLFIHNTPGEMGGLALSADLLLKLVERLPTFGGLVDSSLNWEFQVEVLPMVRKLRPEFLLLSGSEHMVSIYAIGGSGAFSALSAIAPNLVHSLHAACRREDYASAQQPQFAVSKLLSLMKPWFIPALKSVSAKMERHVGSTRPPVMPLPAGAEAELWRALDAAGLPAHEPRGW